jgi:hypothetical protein
MAVTLSALRAGRSLSLGKFLVPIGKFFDVIGNRTRDIPACSKVPQSTTLPRAPDDTISMILFIKQEK